jgi:hypothetical protein
MSRMRAMQEPGGHVGEESQSRAIAPLDYALPRKRVLSVWSVVGFGVSIVCLMVAASMCWWVAKQVYSAQAMGAGFVHVWIQAEPMVIFPIIPICLCTIGLRRGRKILAIAGIVISLISIVVSIVLASRVWG